MDNKAHQYLKEIISSYPSCATMDMLLEHSYDIAGFDWISSKESWAVDVHFPELEVRSALEFIRAELTEYQLSILDKIDAQYKKWINERIFYDRYSGASGGSFTWQGERDEIAETLGRSIPKSHWWLWPPEEV